MKIRVFALLTAAALLLALSGCAAQEQFPSTEATEPSEEATTEATTNPTEETVPTTEEEHVYGEEKPLGKNEKGYVFSKVCQNCGEAEIVYYDAIMTFVDDDAKMQAMLHWEKIIDATGITMTAALIPGKIGQTTDYDRWHAYAGWDLLERMRNKGVDFVNHTYNHKNLTTLTEEELHTDFQMAKDTLQEHGIESDILVYPFNMYNDLVASVAENYFSAAFTCKNQINTEIKTQRYGLYRMHLNEKKVTRKVTFEDGRVIECNDVKSLEKLKSELDAAVQSGGWLVYMAHAYDSPSGKYCFDEGSEQTIIDFCTYAQSLGNVKIVNLTQGYAAAADFPG